MMPVTQRPVASRILSKYETERAYKLHRQKVGSIKHGIDNAPPKRYPHLVLRLKQIQKEEEKMAEVDHQNKLLLQKMTNIMKTHGRIDNWNEEYEQKSLNNPYKQKKMEQIAQENVAIARRLESVQPIYKPDEWEEEYQHRKYLMELWACSTKDYEETPRGHKRQKGDDNDDSRYESDFESDDEAKSNKLPSIDGNEKKGEKKERKPKEESQGTKLPKIQKDRKKTSRGKSDNENDEDGKDDENGKGDKNGKKDGDKRDDRKGGQGRNADGKNDNDQENSKKNDPSSVESDAKQLFKVAKELAPPDEIMIKTLARKSPAQRQQVKKKFQDLYDLDLNKELKSGLGRDWHLLVDELLTDPGDANVSDLHDALKNKNAPVVVEVLCSNQGNLATLKDSYRKAYAVSLEGDVTSNTKEPTQHFLLALLKEGRSESTDVDERRVEKDATVLHEYGDGRWTDKNGKFLSIVGEKSMAHIKAVVKTYKTASGGKEMVQAVKEDCDKDYAEAINAFVANVKAPSDMHAERLYKNLDASNPLFVKTLVSRAEIDMPAVSKSYKRRYDADLVDDIDDRCVHPTAKVLKELAMKTPKKTKGGKKNGGMASNGAQPAKSKPVKKTEKKDDAAGNKGNQKKGPKTTGTIFAAKQFDPAKDIDKLHKAMDGFGTDEQIIIDILVNKNNEQRQVLKKKYKEKYKKDLMKELESELRGDFEELVLALMMEPTEYDAHCLREAVKGPGTSEATLIGILCTRSGKDLKAVKEQYRKKYTSDLENDVRSDTSGDFEEMLVELMKGGRDPNWSVNQKQAEEDAKQLYKEDKSIKASDETFKRLMTKKNGLQFKATSDEYKKLADQELVDSIAASMSGDSKDGYVGLARALEDPIKFYADRLHEGFKGLGTNDTRLIRILVSRSEIDLGDIKAKYAELYGKSLREMVESETSGHFRRTLLAILGENEDKEKKDKGKKENKNPPAKQKDPEKQKPNPKTDKSKNKNKKTDGKKKKDIGERPSPEGQSGENDEKNKKDESKEEDYEEKEWNTMKPTGTVVDAKSFAVEEQVKVLYEAMKGFGTDEDAIIKVLSSCSNAQRQNLKKAYKKKYKKELTSELKGETRGDFEEVVLCLMMTPQEFEVERLHCSMDGLGTDERLLLYTIIINSATPQGLKAVIKKYKDTHKKELSKAVTSETSGLLQKVLLNILAGKRSQSTQVKDKDIDEAANKLHGVRDGENAFKYDVDYCADLFTTLSASQAKAVFVKYREVSGESVAASIEKHTAGAPELTLLAVARYLRSPYAYMAHVLHEATPGTGTNDSLLMAVIVGRSEIDLVNVKMAYKGLFGKSLEDVVESECSGDYRKLLLAVLKEEQKEET